VQPSKAAIAPAAAWVLCALWLGTALAREDAAPQAFDIAHQSLASALADFARQSQLEILFSPELVSGKVSSGLQGTLPPLAALEILLNGSGLSFTRTPSGAILVRPGSKAPDIVSDEAVETSGPLPEVTVRAQRNAERAELTPKVFAFVSQIAAVDGGEGLARWQVPVCPLVSGLPREEGEFLLWRISETARSAGAPLAGDRCRPNLYILVTAAPTELLQAMARRKRPVTFGDAPAIAVDTFIATPRPVRVWYNSSVSPDGSLSTVGGMPCSAEVLGGALFSPPTYCDWERSSRVWPTHPEAFSYVYVVVDETRLRAVSRGQFADYVGLVGLAKLNPVAHVGNIPSILRLFDGTPEAAPAGMSDWDKAFLKSLYGMHHGSKLQQSQIARSMVREIVP
jgi:hypothetical protein